MNDMKFVVLLSGGVDSATCLGIAVDKVGAKNVKALCVHYGQKHKKELDCAANVAKHYGVELSILDLSCVMQFSNCSLLQQSTEAIPEQSYAEQIEQNGEGRVSTYVPFRNGLMLSAAAAFADSVFPNQKVTIFYGAHADDAAGEAYADCSPAFANAMAEAINIGTYKNVFVEAPLVAKNKAAVVKTGLALSVPYELTWSCYQGGEHQCGKCGTCIDRKAAFEANGVTDPVEYMEV